LLPPGPSADGRARQREIVAQVEALEHERRVASVAERGVVASPSAVVEMPTSTGSAKRPADSSNTRLEKRGPLRVTRSAWLPSRAEIWITGLRGCTVAGALQPAPGR
jgi:hypothetical protein